MPSDSLSRFPVPLDQAPALPPTVMAFQWFCLVAGGLNDFAIIIGLMLNQHGMALRFGNGNVDGAQVAGTLILGAMMFPFCILPYWLALAVVYARNDWARGLLYFGAVAFALGTIVAIVESGPFSLGAIGMITETGLGVMALVFLELAPSRDWLRYTVPSFTARNFRY